MGQCQSFDVYDRTLSNDTPDLRLYKWSFQWGSWVYPVARILPKESKSFMKARPIIAYTKCWHTKTSSFLATALFELMQVAFPAQSTWNTASVHKALEFSLEIYTSCRGLL